MAVTVAVIAPGEMGSGIGQRLVGGGARVLTSLSGRSAATAQRAAIAGMTAIAADESIIAQADFLLSIVPPGEACALAERFAPLLAKTDKKPVYVDCNAISPTRVSQIAALVTATGTVFVDGGIIGAPPKPETPGPRLYVSGEASSRVLALREYGLDVRQVNGDIGVASALKLAYATLTKGTVAIGTAMMLGALRNGVAEVLKAELGASQKSLATHIAREVPRMYPKAYRWVAEMEEIANFLSTDAGAHELFRGAAQLYQSVAQNPEIPRLLDQFLSD